MIDDEPHLVTIICRALSPLGIQVEGAHDGKTGLGMALSGEYDLVLLDLKLPALSGISVLRRVMDARPGQEVLVCSGLNDPEQKAQCLELGAVGYVTKPFDLGDLVARVRAQILPRAWPTLQVITGRSGR